MVPKVGGIVPPYSPVVPPMTMCAPMSYVTTMVWEGGAGGVWMLTQLLHWGTNQYILLPQYLHTDYPNF